MAFERYVLIVLEVRHAFSTYRAWVHEPENLSTRAEYRDFTSKRIAGCAAAAVEYQRSLRTGAPVDFHRIERMQENILEVGPGALDTPVLASALEHFAATQVKNRLIDAEAKMWNRISTGAGFIGAGAGFLAAISGPTGPFFTGSSLFMSSLSVSAKLKATEIERGRISDEQLQRIDRFCLENASRMLSMPKDERGRLFLESESMRKLGMRFGGIPSPAEIEVIFPDDVALGPEASQLLKAAASESDDRKAEKLLVEFDRKVAGRLGAMEQQIKEHIDDRIAKLPGEVSDAVMAKIDERIAELPDQVAEVVLARLDERQKEEQRQARKKARDQARAIYRDNEIAAAFNIVHFFAPDAAKPYVQVGQMVWNQVNTITKMVDATTLGPLGVFSMGLQLVANIAGLFGRSGPSFEEQVGKALGAIQESVTKMHEDLIDGFEGVHEHLDHIDLRLGTVLHVTSRIHQDVQELRAAVADITDRTEQNDRDALTTTIESGLSRLDEAEMLGEQFDPRDLRRDTEQLILRAGQGIFIGDHGRSWVPQTAEILHRQGKLRDNAHRWLVSRRDEDIVRYPALEDVRRKGLHTHLSVLDSLLERVSAGPSPAPESAVCSRARALACQPGVLMNPLALAFGVRAIAELWLAFPDSVNERLVQVRGCEYLGRIAAVRETLCYVRSQAFHQALIARYDELMSSIIVTFFKHYDGSFMEQFMTDHRIAGQYRGHWDDQAYRRFPWSSYRRRNRQWRLYVGSPPAEASPHIQIDYLDSGPITARELFEGTPLPRLGVLDRAEGHDTACNVLARTATVHPVRMLNVIAQGVRLGLLERIESKPTNMKRGWRNAGCSGRDMVSFGRPISRPNWNYGGWNDLFVDERLLSQIDIKFVAGQYNGRTLRGYRTSKIDLRVPDRRGAGRVVYLANKQDEIPVNSARAALEMIAQELSSHFIRLNQQGQAIVQSLLRTKPGGRLPKGKRYHRFHRALFSSRVRDEFHGVVSSMAYVRSLLGWYDGKLDPAIATLGAARFPSFETFMGRVADDAFSDKRAGAPVRDTCFAALKRQGDRLRDELLPAPDPTQEHATSNELDRAQYALEAAMEHFGVHPDVPSSPGSASRESLREEQTDVF